MSKQTVAIPKLADVMFRAKVKATDAMGKISGPLDHAYNSALSAWAIYVMGAAALQVTGVGAGMSRSDSKVLGIVAVGVIGAVAALAINKLAGANSKKVSEDLAVHFALPVLLVHGLQEYSGVPMTPGNTLLFSAAGLVCAIVPTMNILRKRRLERQERNGRLSREVARNREMSEGISELADDARKAGYEDVEQALGKIIARNVLGGIGAGISERKEREELDHIMTRLGYEPFDFDDLVGRVCEANEKSIDQIPANSGQTSRSPAGGPVM